MTTRKPASAPIQTQGWRTSSLPHAYYRCCVQWVAVPGDATPSYWAVPGPCSIFLAARASVFCQLFRLTTRRNMPASTASLDPSSLSIDIYYTLPETPGLWGADTGLGFSGVRSEKRSHAGVSLAIGVALPRRSRWRFSVI
jgi:hypothetical protein